ncbi:saccharopine dehydrogenase family protein [Mycobacterium sp. NPDC003449]
MTAVLLYGATGYTGIMVAEHATKLGLRPVLAGRSVDALRGLAARLDCPYVVFDVDDRAAAEAALSGMTVLLNCAGPYLRTARPLMQAAIATGVHYLDIAAELDSYRLAEGYNAAATEAGVMLLPGSGGSVAMLGCLAGHTADRVPDPQRVRVALHVAGSMSRGSAISAGENLTTDTLHRVHGSLVARDPAAVELFDFGFGAVPCSPVTLPDLVTLWRSTGIGNIDTYVYASGDAFPGADVAGLPDGPSAQQRDIDRYHAVAEVTGGGQVARSVLDTVNGYTFTSSAAAHAAGRVLDGQHRPGFRTPAEVFGIGFAETIADTRITDLEGNGAHERGTALLR